MSSTTAAIPGMGWASVKPEFRMGPRTLAVPMSLHRAARRNLCTEFKKRGAHYGLALIKGGSQQLQYDSDTELVFRQCSWFNYLFGVKEPEFFGAIDVATEHTTLFMPRQMEEYQMWCGTIYPPEYFKKHYDVDEVRFADQLSEWLIANGVNKIHAMEGVNTDSGTAYPAINFPNIEKFRGMFDTSTFYAALATARVTKNDDEVATMRYAAYVASNAHVATMRSAAPGQMEFELEATFMYNIYKHGGCRKAAYTSICACGPNAATLHYGHAGAPNNRQLLSTDIGLLDMGADYHGYVSDITCSYPMSGKFSADQAAIFNAVLAAQEAVMDMARPGVSWVDCHRAAEVQILTHLVSLGVLRGDVQTMADAGMGAVFFPHGLGHLIGCDTHDVGGYMDDTPARASRPGLKNLRTARVLQANMVLTNEPGCYFIDYILDSALADPARAQYINNDILQRFRGFGGVRLEDVIVITQDGVKNLTTCPRTVTEVESVMAGGAWPPSHDEAPRMRRQWGKLDEQTGLMVDIQL